MSIKLPIVNVKDINWNNHDSSIVIFQDIVVGDIAVIESKSECVLPLDDGEYCVTIDNENVFIEESFSFEECKILFGKDFGKSYVYFISLLTENCYDNYVEGKYIEGDGLPVCVDFSVAKGFKNVDDAHKYAKEKANLKLGEYAIHGFYM